MMLMYDAPKHRMFRGILVRLVSGALVLQSAPLAAAAQDVDRLLDASQLAACKSVERRLEDSLRPIIAATFKTRLSSTDIDYEIDKAWSANNADQILANRIQIVGDDIIKESSTWDLLATLGAFVGDKAKLTEYATKITTRVMESKDVRDTLGIVTEAASLKVGESLALGLQGQEATLRECVVMNVGSRYGTGFANLVRTDLAKIGKESQINPRTNPTTTYVPTAGIAGVALIVMRRQIRRYVLNGVVRRVVGGMIARIIAEIATGIGAFLVVYEIWQLKDGLVPHVIDGMKKPESLESMKGGVKAATHEFMQGHSDELAASTAKAIHSEWIKIKHNYAALAELAEKHEKFRSFLSRQEQQSVRKVSQLVSIELSANKENGVLDSIDRGVLEQAVNELEPAGITVASDLKSLPTALLWQEKAGTGIVKIVDYGLHKMLNINEERSASLRALLEIDQKLVVQRLALLGAATRMDLIRLDRKKMIDAILRLTKREVASYGKLLSNVDDIEKGYFDGLLLSDPERLKPVLHPGAVDVVLASTDRKQAAQSLSRESAMAYFDLPGDFASVVRGDVSTSLLLHKHPLAIGILAVMIALLVLSFLRLFFGRKTKLVIKTPQAESSQS